MLSTCISAVSLARGMSPNPSSDAARSLSFFLLHAACLISVHATRFVSMLVGTIAECAKGHPNCTRMGGRLHGTRQQLEAPLQWLTLTGQLQSRATGSTYQALRRACRRRPWRDRGSRTPGRCRSGRCTGCRPQSCRRRSPGRTAAARGRSRSAACNGEPLTSISREHVLALMLRMLILNLYNLGILPHLEQSTLTLQAP